MKVAFEHVLGFINSLWGKDEIQIDEDDERLFEIHDLATDWRIFIDPIGEIGYHPTISISYHGKTGAGEWDCDIGISIPESENHPVKIDRQLGVHDAEGEESTLDYIPTVKAREAAELLDAVSSLEEDGILQVLEAIHETLATFGESY